MPMSEQDEMDRKACDLLLSTDPDEVNVGKSLVFSKFNFTSGMPVCFLLLICRSISSKYKKLVFKIRVFTKSDSTKIEMMSINSRWEGDEHLYFEFDVSDDIFKLARQFRDVRKRKSLRQVELWVSYQVPKLFMRMLPETLEGRPREKVPDTKVFF